jgi:peptidyl-prolyl cis-trans isomerase SurA
MASLRFESIARAALLLGLVTALVPPAAAQDSTPTDAPRLAEGVVAVVDGEPLLWSELRTRLRPHLARAQPQERQRVYRESLGPELDALIDAKLVEQEARRRSIEVSKEEIARSLAAIADQNGGSLAQLLGEIEKIGWTRAIYEAEIGSQLLRFKVLSAYRVSSHPELVLAHP